ncbi:GNAT family N-acetyltransferase [Brevibacterium album]|uniref:GNAT family N-acetyltransferase n=1 Tax=Brevibacterium album TaxID=417948 RepID=UPI0004052CBC|nr:GNAT family N-acetyltransferase [Brevibacterium album]
MEPVTLTTPRLELSAPTAADEDAIFAVCQDPDIQRWTTVPSPYTCAHAEGFVALTAQGWEKDAEHTWAIRTGAGAADRGRPDASTFPDDPAFPDASALVGMISLSRNGPGAAEIGYWLAPSARGRGLLAEAATAVLDWGFSAEGMALERIIWRAKVGNIASARTARALGFRYEGLLRKGLRMQSGGVDGWIAGLLDSDDRTTHPWPVLAD